MSSETKRHDIICAGDSVVLFMSPQRAVIVPSIDPTTSTQTQFGVFPHSSIIGRPFGSRVVSTGKITGWAYALRLTSELWSRFLPHRTQVLYSADISTIVSRLSLAPGCRVLEAGTGSASLTFALSKAVGSTGRVFSFDFHAERSAAAAESFTKLGISNVVFSCGDACAKGAFDRASDGSVLTGSLDAVFYDLPACWDAVENAFSVLKTGGSICVFTPCIEQAQRTVVEMGEGGRFAQFCTVEVLERRTLLRKGGLPDAGDLVCGEGDRDMEEKMTVAVDDPVARGHTGFLTFAVKVL